MNTLNVEEPSPAETRKRAGLRRRIAASDKRIAAAVAQLRESDRGVAALSGLASLVLEGPLSGLDESNWNAFAVLVMEARAGRRDFLREVRQWEEATEQAQAAERQAGWDPSP